MTTLPSEKQSHVVGRTSPRLARCQTEARRSTAGPSSVRGTGRECSREARGGGDRGLPPRAGCSGRARGRRRNGSHPALTRPHSAGRTGLTRRRRGQLLGRGLGAVLTAGGRERGASAGTGREPVRSAGSFPDTVTVSRAAAVSVAATVSLAATSGGSRAVTPTAGAPASTASTSSTTSTLRERGSYRESHDCQAEHECAKRGHVHSASFVDGKYGRPTGLPASTMPSFGAAVTATMTMSCVACGEPSQCRPPDRSRVRRVTVASSRRVTAKRATL
jgi:hypothetical protein